MTRKQKIVETAQQLFADRGYENTSTQLIAREAEVSEALIFKHFGNKEQLLAFIIKNGYRRVVEKNRGSLQGGEPLQFIYKMIELPYKLVSEEPQFWKLQYRLGDLPMSLKEHERFMQPVSGMLVKAFRELGYANPEEETEFLLMTIDALWKREIVKGPDAINKVSEFIKGKYEQPA